MAKKPAQLSDSLLVHRPRKGDAKPQTEAQAVSVSTPAEEKPTVPKQKTATKGRRRVRRSQNTEQLNLRISPETLERFTNLADKENVIFGEMLVRLINKYEEK
jgi:chemotaxis protein histidine kinase CheA